MNIHKPEQCAGEPCPFHNPSEHALSGARMDIRATGLVERECEHGIGHPDPDSVAYLNAHGATGAKGSWGVHTCDGCCGAAAA